MSALRWAAVLTAHAVLAACAVKPAQTPAPARLSNVDDAARAVLANAVAQALDGREVSLAPDALIASSRLLLDPARPRDASGRLLQGRETRAPESFQLMKVGAECVLRHERTAKEYVLQGVRCEIEAP
ncbi:MAG: hypothetical protein ABW110_09685 [Steroidobacteraceae bacterium]